jgi:hypothetical protein
MLHTNTQHNVQRNIRRERLTSERESCASNQTGATWDELDPAVPGGGE